MKIVLLLLILSQTIWRCHAFLGLINYWSNIVDRIVASKLKYYEQNRRQFTLEEEYDFIIVGSGSAGAVLANRLSENNNWTVLLLEAGNWANPFTEVPMVAPVLQLTPFNWGYTMERNEGLCVAMEDQRCSWPRGRAIGGSSVINYMIYSRGNPLDFQKWEAQGNPGWSYEDVLPYYIKSEKCNLGSECNSKYHGHDGYLSTEYPYSTKLTSAFIKAGIQLGHKKVDYNTPNYMGFAKIQATLKRGRRHSVSSAFLDPIKARPNLKIVPFARVTKILIDPASKTAFGVEFQKSKEKFTAHSRKEVILSAGTFHSPQLLMLSGVGPERHLKELGIPLIKDLPVGQTLYDHIAHLGVLFTINQTVISSKQFYNVSGIYDWINYGRGFFSSLGGIEAVAYIKTEVSREKKPSPDIELLLAAIGSLQFDLGSFSREELRVRRDIYNEYFKPLENTPCFAILPMLLHPKSKGYLKLRSSNPFDPPLLYGNYFTDDENIDMRTMLSAVRFIQKLTNQKAFKKYGAKFYEKPFPGCQTLIFDSDDYWRCAFRNLVISAHHQISTCKMGPIHDREAVVDDRLKVYGIQKLRVADSSIIPVTLSGHTNAPTIMIGEKLSDILKEDWNNQMNKIDLRNS